MTKPPVPNTKAKTFGQAPKAGATKPTPSSKRPQKHQVPPAAPDPRPQVPFDEAETVPRAPFIRRQSGDPPVESDKGDDDVMNQA